jgi:aryl-alcohol dehydrogenase-like predicted oxidoreductase
LANRPIIEAIQLFADKKNATPAQISLALLLAQRPWIVPIPGTRNIDHLDENLGATQVQLTPADLREIEARGQQRLRGARHQALFEKQSYA